ncbi:hypothetical protein [Paenibacillus sp. 481]|uniref:hypothetical protein n=1 Tax=Paenibacillus sp. 481 TaxID=2835869 RepID=UPI001E34BA8D|nr:hypothetical protein [Paenibacillus sp. 481]UHA72079.1 hypothetical protein KIK04_15350 [Paenibacillus sp. 481]
MPFQPNVNDELHIGEHSYVVEPHPLSADVPYGQEGRQGTVYRLKSTELATAWALKVFRPNFRHPALVYQAEQLAPYAKLPGMQVCKRQIMTPQHQFSLISQHPELLYAVLMPWIEGPTWMDVLLDKRPLSRDTTLLIGEAAAMSLATLEQRGMAHGDLSAANVILAGLNEANEVEQRGNEGIVSFVDVEQMCAPGLYKPEIMPTGTSGYARKSGTAYAWNSMMDRFSGGVMLAEMLAWCDEGVRKAAWGESYFNPELMTLDQERTDILLRALSVHYGETTAFLFQRVWGSTDNTQCPTFGEWAVALKSKLLSAEEDEADRVVSGAVTDAVAQRERHLVGLVTMTEQAAAKSNEVEHNGERDDAESNNKHSVIYKAVHGDDNQTGNSSTAAGAQTQRQSQAQAQAQAEAQQRMDFTTDIRIAQQDEKDGRWEAAVKRYEQLLLRIPNASTSDIGVEIQIALQEAKQAIEQREAQYQAELAVALAKRQRLQRVVGLAGAICLLLGGAGGILYWAPWNSLVSEQVVVTNVSSTSSAGQVNGATNNPAQDQAQDEAKSQTKGQTKSETKSQVTGETASNNSSKDGSERPDVSPPPIKKETRTSNDKPINPTKPDAQNKPANQSDTKKSGALPSSTSNKYASNDAKSNPLKRNVESKSEPKAKSKPAREAESKNTTNTKNTTTVKQTKQPEQIKPAKKEPTKQEPTKQEPSKSDTQQTKKNKIKALEDSLLQAFNVEDDTEKAIKVAKQLKQLDPTNTLASKMLKELVGGS